MEHGVTQGSVVGPTLFLLVNKWASIKYSEGNFILFVDDTNLLLLKEMRVPFIEKLHMLWTSNGHNFAKTPLW
jgi:hypothetical protein